MINGVKKYALVCFSMLLLCSCVFLELKNTIKSAIEQVYTDNDYKLKFVDSSQVELGLSFSYKVIQPVEIIEISEQSDGWIALITHENAVVYAPVDAQVVACDNGCVSFRVSKLTITIKNMVSGVVAGQKVKCGEIVGSVNGTQLFARVQWGSKTLSYNEIKEMV